MTPGRLIFRFSSPVKFEMGINLKTAKMIGIDYRRCSWAARTM
jgi:hypothetical protein